MRKSISITDNKVIKVLEESSNASQLIQVAVLYYLGEVSKDYVDTFKQVQEVNNMLKLAKK